ncbi:ISSoc1, transposase [Synechococcus sp. JA-2-3B'a(2-13)]|uniref:RNA-guided endonuclease InsQ/TnpB family protein n=1 Tax=Synechococcus sp. (strain JA-2-3B'a(2-13)) TaxID=321332 RepID=UPI0000694BA9|nr:RNA-guided endonuclease TnpB family protein [Synechococcus sp. JA-2-3B'a(2-13)]ABD01587.1 ISSoc1, transposase [Synechococcus sp. JA-2-3B'a(2-13)]
MTQVLTVSCKLKVSQSQAAKLDATMEAFGQALNWVNQNTPEKVANAVKLQSLCYREIRARFGLSSNLAQQVCRRLAGARKVARQKNRPVKVFKGGFATYDARIFSFREKDWTVSLTTVEGRERFELAIGRYQREQLTGSNPKSATLVKRKDGSYFIQICVEAEPSPPQRTGRVLGVDLGRTDIAHTSEGDNWNGQQLNKVRDHYSRLRAVLQRKASKGTRSSRRRCRQLLQRLSGKERRFQAWVNHRISKAIVSRAKTTNSAIALEDLTGIRERVNQQPRGKTECRRANSWAFYQLRMFVAYKAAIAGVPVVLVSPAYTSQTCHRCLHIHPDPTQSYRSGKSFKCGHCGWEGDADLNGANVIALLGAVVNQPRGPGLFCSLVEQNRLRATESPLRTA